MRGTNFWTGMVGVFIGALLVTALPAIAQDAAPQAAPGDGFKLGVTNVVNATTALRGATPSNLLVRNTGDGVPLRLLTNGNGEPPMKVDSRRLVKNLNADQLDFRHANELIRANFASTTNAADADGNAVSASITAPKPGYLIMGGSIEAFGSTEDFYTCRLTVGGTEVVGSRRDARVHDAAGTHTSNNEENCSTDGGHVVDTGTYTVAFDIVNHTTVSFNSASVWVIWVPFNGVGDVPMVLGDPTSGQPASPADEPKADTP